MATVSSVRRLLDDEANDADDFTENVRFLVEFVEGDLTPAEVARVEHAEIPAKKSLHPSVSGLRVASKRAYHAPARKGPPSKTAWIIEVQYARIQVSGSTANSRNITIRVSGREETDLTQISRGDNSDGSDDLPILNAVRDRYPDPVEVTLYDEVIEVVFETKTLNMDLIAESRGKINLNEVSMNFPQGADGSLPFSRTFAKKTLLLKSCDYEAIVSDTDDSSTSEVYAYKVSLVLIHRPDGWSLRLPQKGYRWWYDASDPEAEGEIVQTLTRWQEHAEYLDADGYRLEDGAQIVTLDPPVQMHYAAPLDTLIAGI